MAKEKVTWERDEHTKAKHDLLRTFFNKWVSIHSEWFARHGGGLVRIYDGFAGPGIYTGGEPGSPVILLSALCAHPRLREHWGDVDFELHFVERHVGRAQTLEGELEALEARMRTHGNWSERISWTVTPGNYEDHVPQPVVGRRSALFLFLDPFGYSRSPMTLTKDLIQQAKSDTLIFLPLSFVNRFAKRDGQEPAMDRFFGDPSWREIPSGKERPQKLLVLFEKQLRSGGLTWVSDFRLKPDGSNEYWIVGGSRDLKGFASIKEAFWAVDPVNGRGFVSSHAPTPGQQTLAFEEPARGGPNVAPLLALLREHFGENAFTVEQAMQFTEESTFLERHLKRMTLAKAESDGVLLVERPRGVRQFKEGKGTVLRFK